MDNFIFALNATLPVFLIMVLGWFLQRIGLLNPVFCKTADNYVFRCALPFSLFQSISSMDLYSQFDLPFCVFCFLATTVMFLGVWLASSLLLKDRSLIGAFAQASARSSAAILGVAFAVSIYGDSGMVPMMIVAAVPFFNIYAVLILSFSPQKDDEGRLISVSGQGAEAIKKACKNVLTNPIIIGILAGVPFALLSIPVPQMLKSAVGSIGATASPIALLVIGASFAEREAFKHWRLAMVSSCIKLLVLPGIFLPLAAVLGFHGSELVAILIMTGSPTTVACYVMSRNMRADSTLTSNAIVISTLMSSVTITFWIFLLKSFQLI